MLMCLVHSAMEKAIFLRIKMTPFSFFFAFLKKKLVWLLIKYFGNHQKVVDIHTDICLF